MANQQIVEYIKGELSKGITKDDVKNALIKVGWSIADVEDAMLAAVGVDPAPPSSTPSPEPLINNAYSEPENRNIPSGIHTFSSAGQSNDDWFKGTKPAPKRERTIIIVAVLALLLIAGGVFGYTYYSQIPEIVLKKMAGRMKSVKTMAFSGEVNADLEITPQDTEIIGLTSGSVKIIFDGVTDENDKANPKASFKMAMSSSSQGIEVSLGTEMKMIGKVTYIRVTEFPLMETLGIGNLRDQWIKIDIEAIAQKYNLTKLEAQLKTQNLFNNLNSEQKNQIDKIWKDELVKMAKQIVKLKDEKVNGTNSYHYQIPLDKAALEKLTLQTIDILGTEIIKAEEKEMYAEAIKMMEFKTIELWVGKKDNLPTKMVFDVTLNLPEEGGKYGLNYILYFKDYNKAVAIEAPADSKPVEEIIEALLGTIGVSPDSQKDARAITTMRQIASEAEMLYVRDNSYINLLCSNPDLKLLCDDIDQTMGGYPLIRKPAGSRPAKYCAVIILKELSGSNKQYYCVDSSGANMKTPINPTTSYCTKSSFSCPPSFID